MATIIVGLVPSLIAAILFFYYRAKIAKQINIISDYKATFSILHTANDSLVKINANLLSKITHYQSVMETYEEHILKNSTPDKLNDILTQLLKNPADSTIIPELPGNSAPVPGTDKGKSKL